MTVKCYTFSEFMEVVASSVEKGLKFEASADQLVIEYTGGY